MTKTILLATTAILLSAGAAAAQTPPLAAAASGSESAGQGILVFTPDFFADQRPNTALDMVSRVPGFSVQDGDGSRGFEGAVGNVLINGSRPASKNDTGSSVLSRTLVPQVERIELIRGGAPGIDMQGYSVVVNVITRNEGSTEQILTANMAFFEGGADRGFGQYQFTRRNGDRVWGFTLADGVAIDDSSGVGRVIRRDAGGTIVRNEGYYNDQNGGGQAVRVNFADAFMGGKIDLTARYGLNDYSQFSLQDGPTILRDNRYAEEGSSGEVGAVFTRPMAEGLTSETRLIREWSEFENASTSLTTTNGIAGPEQRFASDGHASETILRSLLRWERSPALTLEAGGEIAYNMLEVDQALTDGGVVIPLPSDQIMVEETRGELFGKATWRVRPDLNLEGGLRLEASTITQSGDADQEKSYYFAKPRLQLTWPPARTLRTNRCSAAM
jgi:hypothetical protein